MSDEVEKSVEDQLTDVVKSAVTEATAEMVALKETVANIEIPSVDGFVKEETVAELREELKAEREAREDLKAIVDNAPAIIKGEKPMESEYFKWDGDLTLQGRGAGNFNRTSIDVSKAFTSTTNITGAPTASQTVFHSLLQMNPFRGASTIYATSGTAVNLPRVSNVTAQNEASIPDSIDLSAVPPHGGAITSVQVIPQNWTSRTAFSDQSIEDLPSLDQMVGSFQAQQIAVAEAVDMVGQLDGSSAVAQVNTGQAAALPDSIDPWADLMAAISSAYLPNAQWFMSRQAYAHLRSTTQGGTGSDLLYDAGLGKMSFLGYPITINDHLDAGTVAGQNPVYFGDFRRGTVIVSRKDMQISRHEDTIPGALYYYGNMRSRGVVWDPAALARFNVAA